MKIQHLVGLAALAAAIGGAPALAQDADGSVIVNTRCNVCHGDPDMAPPLKGVAGRPIASTAFSGYSDALKAHKSETWTDDKLNAFLTNTQAFASGSWMDFQEPDAKARAAVIAYLKTLK
jgi:cytochrome c